MLENQEAGLCFSQVKINITDEEKHAESPWMFKLNHVGTHVNSRLLNKRHKFPLDLSQVQMDKEAEQSHLWFIDL